MGPCLFRHGNLLSLDSRRKRTLASMGPCLFRHGNRYTVQIRAKYGKLQWGRAFSGTEIFTICLWLQHPISRFNGAVPFQARKSPADTYTPDVPYASMGPCLFRHGNRTIPTIAHIERASFNGAVPFQARKYTRTCIYLVMKCKLQWGRAFSGTEISTSSGSLRAYRACFNGAVPFQARKCSVSTLWQVRGYVGFNGAVPFQARKCL